MESLETQIETWREKMGAWFLRKLYFIVQVSTAFILFEKKKLIINLPFLLPK